MRPSAAALALLALISGCGIASREAQLRPALREHPDASKLLELRGADPLIPMTWLVSASSAPDPEAALAIVDRGLEYLPGQPDLTWMRLSLLAQLELRPAVLESATSALGSGPPGALVPELIAFRLDSHLATDDLASAEADALALGSVSQDDPRAASSAWAALALTDELLGNVSDADSAMDLSLASGPRGLLALRQHAGLDRARVKAATDLVQRASLRQPRNPDILLYLAVQSMLDDQPDAARSTLDSLPAPLPARLVPDREALYARLDLLQGRVDEGLARLQARLDAYPDETGSLAVLLECWNQYGRPSDAEMKARLSAGLRRSPDPALVAAMEAALKAIEKSEKAAVPSGSAP